MSKKNDALMVLEEVAVSLKESAEQVDTGTDFTIELVSSWCFRNGYTTQTKTI